MNAHRFSGKAPQKIIILLLCVLAAVLLITADRTVVRTFSDDISAVSARTEDGSILISWSLPSDTRITAADVTITDQDGVQMNVSVPAGEGSYSFTDGTHGSYYTADVCAVYKSGRKGKAQSAEAMFLNYSDMSGLPLLVINSESGEDPSYKIAENDEDAAFGVSISGNDFIDAQVSDPGEEILPDDTGVQIRVRGNTSSALYDKKSYKLRFDKPMDLCGLGSGYEAADWVLLNNAANLRTFLGYEVSSLCGIEWQLHMRYVNLILNGDYKGCYILTEAVDRESSRGLVSDDGYIFENDVYWWNSDGMYIRTSDQSEMMAYTFKYPEFAHMTDYRVSRIYDYLESFDQALFSDDSSYADYIDIDSFASWILARDILSNSDGGGSNMYFYKYDFNPDDPTSSKVKMGPLWDFDMIFENYDFWSSSRDDDVYFFGRLFEQDDFNEAYCSKWYSIHDTLYEDLHSAMDELIADEGAALDACWMLDAVRWGDDFVSVEDRENGADGWFADRVTWMDSQLGAD